MLYVDVLGCHAMSCGELPCGHFLPEGVAACARFLSPDSRDYREGSLVVVSQLINRVATPLGEQCTEFGGMRQGFIEGPVPPAIDGAIQALGWLVHCLRQVR